MPIKRFEIQLDDENIIYVYFTTIHGEVVDFVVKYIALIDGKEYEILRFDCAHGMPHVDILDPTGETVEKRWIQHLDNKQALTNARYNIELNYPMYRDRFIKWLKKEK